MYDEQHFTRDAADVRFDGDAPGITVDDGNVTIDWDEVATTTIDNPPHAEAFDSKEFYKLPATVARPIAQPYQFGDDGVTWLKKPREELKKAAWSLDNAPWTLGHPETGMVKDVDDVHGFWKDPRYIDSLDDLDADLHVPTGDEEAKDFIEEHDDVSVGFYNRIARLDEYDGVVGGQDDENVDVDGYQTEMLFDHVASVPIGRCPSDEGCGLDDAGHHGHVDSFKRGAMATHKSDETDTESDASTEAVDSAEGTVSMQETTDEGRTIDGTWYAVPPEDTDGDEPKYPIENCADVEDAWQLRGHAKGLTIEQSTLENRIQDRARSLDCDVPGEETQDSIEGLQTALDRYDIACADCGQPEQEDTDMTDGFELNLDDLSTDAALTRVADQHDGVADRLDELASYEEAADVASEAAEEIEIDDVSNLADAVSVLKEERDALEEELQEARRPQMEEDAEFIADRTERYGEDADEVIENLDADPETVAEKRELVEDLTEGYDEATANPGDAEGSGTDESTTDSSGYAKTPWN